MAGLSPPIPTCPGEAQHPPTHPPYPTGERRARVRRLAAHSAIPNLYGGGDGSSILLTFVLALKSVPRERDKPNLDMLLAVPRYVYIRIRGSRPGRDKQLRRTEEPDTASQPAAFKHPHPAAAPIRTAGLSDWPGPGTGAGPAGPRAGPRLAGQLRAAGPRLAESRADPA